MSSTHRDDPPQSISRDRNARGKEKKRKHQQSPTSRLDDCITGHMNLPTFRHTPGSSSITCLGVRARANPPRLRLRLLGRTGTELYCTVPCRRCARVVTQKRGGGLSLPPAHRSSIHTWELFKNFKATARRARASIRVRPCRDERTRSFS
ncbi:uncharacterized protein K489DRAFT_102456 [Dissoconium aciculare CBS 342.82]|uniref:Uncharacterized protein n=1 Tax=Dissoconium aciculare CBS 342.82 TaxID=1314786 RepID=A0A6J3MEB1_9PEZI|nr:uncharacterized protein K489DRAFT_102456 [Dissoconium aciculare CBS 342.82]KAF1825949.1 hypothetical protein K489DRAFT_102456 [Dissoconium aciculare CBS 342.82]